MSISVGELQAWLCTLNQFDLVGIDEDGLTLQCEEHPEVYLEVGGLPEGTPPPPYSSGGPPYDAATATGMYDREG